MSILLSHQYLNFKKKLIYGEKKSGYFKNVKKEKILLYGKSLPARAVVLINMLKIDEKLCQ